jgi:hypothetical protein
MSLRTRLTAPAPVSQRVPSTFDRAALQGRPIRRHVDDLDERRDDSFSIIGGASEAKPTAA